MEELFRFTITRAAERRDVATIPLGRRSALQEQLTSPLDKAAKRATASATPLSPSNDWAVLENAALAFVRTNLNWIVALSSETPASPLPALRQLLTDLQTVQPGSAPESWLS